ncbi:hypothetical protein [Lysobacter gummosus]|uniref:hypothetical protein n=1 Tax=Lysobacter gummosus TaxID=262324 RepID=UPI0036256B7D
MGNRDWKVRGCGQRRRPSDPDGTNSCSAGLRSRPWSNRRHAVGSTGIRRP